MRKLSTLTYCGALLIINITLANNAFAENWEVVYSKPFIESIINTSEGLFIGHLDLRTTNQTDNGIEISKDFGVSWQDGGLRDSGITSLLEDEDYIYATTYFVKNNWVGLYRHTKGNTTFTWEAIGPKFPMTAVCTNSNNLVIGSFSNGLWVQNKATGVFIQKIGNGYYGPKILGLHCNKNLVIAGSTNKTYISTNYGNTFSEIAALENKQFKYFLSDDVNVYAGSFDNSGLYTSADFGTTWSKNESFGSNAVMGLNKYKDCLYAGKINSGQNTYSIYKACNNLESWENTNLNVGQIKNIIWLYAAGPLLYANSQNTGITRTKIYAAEPETFPFLDTPWNTKTPSDLFDRITAYFDHSYPTLGSRISEPAEEKNSILNFYNIRGLPPEMYYSSHSGTDFALAYGTDVLAPADGLASYFFCSDCGHSIRIDHLNGYVTEYMHLQKAALYLTNGTLPIQKGTVVGKVGLSGRTTGPHLHFEVKKSGNVFPFSRTDPFGWLSTEAKDPWASFTDIIGSTSYQGSDSKYLWTTALPHISSTITPNNIASLIKLENKIFNLSEEEALTPFTLELKPLGIPVVPRLQQNLSYIHNTSFILDLINPKKEPIKSLPNGIDLEIRLDQNLLNDVIISTIKLYTFSPVTLLWEAVTQSWYDEESSVLRAKIEHLSSFGVFGTKIDALPPLTELVIICTQQNGWCVTNPKIDIVPITDTVNKIFYSTDSGSTWDEYTATISSQSEGFLKILYRGMDSNGNLEETNEATLKINTRNAFTQKVVITNAGFSSAN